MVPDFAEVFYYVRQPNPSGVEEIWERLENAARGAAMGTGTEVEWEIIHGNNPLLVNEALAKVMHAKLLAVGGVEYTPEERAWAEEIQTSLGDAAKPGIRLPAPFGQRPRRRLQRPAEETTCLLHLA